jgi:hypothetical protein
VISSVFASANRLVFSGSNGPANGTYYVLTSTNLALPVAAWTPVSTNSFDASGHFTVTNAVNPVLPQQFYRLFAP